MKKDEVLEIIHKLWLNSNSDEMRNEAANAYTFIKKYMEE